MKISEMSNDQATDAIVRITSAFSFVRDDKEVEALLEKFKNEDDNGNVFAIIDRYLNDVVTLLFRKHKDSGYEIVSALTGVEKKAVGGMNFFETIGAIRENVSELKTLFFSSAGKTSNSEI